MALSGATTPGQSGPRSDGNKVVLRIPRSSSITGTSPSDCLVLYPGHSLKRGLTPLQRCSWCILKPQPTGQTKRCNFRVKWRGGQKEHIRQEMIWHLRMQCTLSMIHFGEQLFTTECRFKDAHYLLGDKVEESSRWKKVVLTEIKDVTSKKFGLQIFARLKI